MNCMQVELAVSYLHRDDFSTKPVNTTGVYIGMVWSHGSGWITNF